MSETTALVFGCAVFTSGAQHNRTTVALVLLYIITFDLLLRLDFFLNMNGDYCVFHAILAHKQLLFTSIVKNLRAFGIFTS